MKSNINLEPDEKEMFHLLNEIKKEFSEKLSIESKKKEEFSELYLSTNMCLDNFNSNEFGLDEMKKECSENISLLNIQQFRSKTKQKHNATCQIAKNNRVNHKNGWFDHDKFEKLKEMRNNKKVEIIENEILKNEKIQNDKRIFKQKTLTGKEINNNSSFVSAREGFNIPKTENNDEIKTTPTQGGLRKKFIPPLKNNKESINVKDTKEKDEYKGLNLDPKVESY